jgi:hypothetical protein
LLREAGEPRGLGLDRGDQIASLRIGVVSELRLQELQVERHRGERVTDLVCDVRGHLPDRGEALRLDDLPARCADGFDHPLERAR